MSLQLVRASKTSSDVSGNEDDNKEPKEPDYDDDNEEKSDKVGEDKQEQETGEITTNQVF
jgi:hypothetical protein